MLKTIKDFLGSKWRRNEPTITIDYALQPMVPSGARRILHHQPAGAGSLPLLSGSLEIVEFLPGTTYAQYRIDHADEPLGDAVILDAIIRKIQAAIERPAELEKFLEKFLGSFSGQIFFLGTTYESEDGRECVPYLNIKTRYPAFRYLCPMNQIINHDVKCCACFLR
jgi:hypothetical protein